MIAELKSDTLIKYIFVKKFTWLDPTISESLAGHPIPGRVYKSIYNINTKHHRLLLPDGLVMGFNVLIGMREDADFELIEVTTDNILDFDIKEEDLDIFLTSEVQPIQTLQQAMQQQEADEDDASDRASHIIMSLYQIAPRKFEVILELAERLMDSELIAHEDITTWMRYHPTKGLPLNTAKAFKALDQYAGDDRRTSEDPEDLYEALEAIIVELDRVSE